MHLVADSHKSHPNMLRVSDQRASTMPGAPLASTELMGHPQSLMVSQSWHCRGSVRQPALPEKGPTGISV